MRGRQPRAVAVTKGWQDVALDNAVVAFLGLLAASGRDHVLACRQDGPKGGPFSYKIGGLVPRTAFDTTHEEAGMLGEGSGCQIPSSQGPICPLHTGGADERMSAFWSANGEKRPQRAPFQLRKGKSGAEEETLRPHISHINPARCVVNSNISTRCSRIAEHSGYHEC